MALIDSNKKINISVIMPALNEEKNIHSAVNNTLAAFNSLSIEGEIIIVNDGSTDNTDAIIKQIIKTDSRVSMLVHKIPQGIGASFWDGVDNALGQAVIMLPGDNENDPWEALRYHKLLEHVDIVIPFVFNRETRPAFRNILSLMYRLIINTTFHVNFNYTNGTVLYRRSMLNELAHHSSGFFFQTDILIRSVKKGYLFAEVPYRLGIRKDGVSKAVSFPSLLKVIKGYIRLVRDYYFTKDMKSENVFSNDSLTALRRKNPTCNSID